MKVVFPKLSGANYSSWQYRMQTLLERDEVWYVIVTAKPEEQDATLPQWKRDDAKARATIAFFVEDSQLRFIKKSTTAREMWDNLKTYHNKATIGNQASLLRQLCALRLEEGGDVERHIEQTEDLFEKLDNAGVELQELLRIIMLLRSLPRSFDSFVTSLENRPQVDLTMDFVISRLRDENQKRASQQSCGVGAERAMKVDAQKPDKRKCYFCNQPGHFRRQCRKFLAAKKSDKPSESKQATSDQHAKQAQAESAPVQVSDDTVVYGAVCFVAGGAIAGAWTVDSGCTCHMTNDRSFFNEFKKDVIVDVTLADGTKTRSAGCGSGVFFGINGEGKRVAITLDNVLYVPNLEGGLISVRKLALKEFMVTFTASGCEIRTAGGSVVAVGETVGSQYKLKEAEECLAVKGNHHEQCQHTWHRRMGHRDMDIVSVIEKNDMVSGFEIKDCGARIVCECCLKGKLARRPFPQITERKSSQPLDLIHTDVCGPMDNPTPGGNKYLMTMIDDCTRYCVVYLLKSKSDAADKIKEYVRSVENLFGRKPRAIRSDGGGEYVGTDLLNFYKAEGIHYQFTTPYTPQQNGVAERKNRALQEMANCLLLDAGLPKRYWGEAVMTAVHLQNRLPTRAVQRTPYELWTGQKPDFKQLRVFGCQAYVHIPDAKRKKFEPKAEKLIFVGYSEHHKGYRFLNRNTDRIIISRDARFVELGNGSEQREAADKLNGAEEPVEVDAAPSSGCEVEVMNNREEIVAEAPEQPEEEVYEDAESDFLGFELEDDMYYGEEEQVRRSNRATRGVLPTRYDDFVVGLATRVEEPTDYREALAAPEWKQAMVEEMQAHKENDTWTLERLPAGKKLIGAKWVFKLKKNEAGEVIKYKARVVAQGYSQKYGVDYTEVFAPVTRLTTLRAMLAVAGKRGMLVKQYDAKTAYLNGRIEEELYMRQPPGFAAPGQEEFVCKLQKSIYGLRQSARCWNKALHAALLDIGFKQRGSDPCLYVFNSSGVVIYLLVYVDDFLMACTEEAEIDRVFVKLREKFDITSLGNVRYFLGHEIVKEGEYYTMQLTAYIDSLIEKFGMEGSKPVRTPMDTGYITQNADSKNFQDTSLYRSLVGALLYIAVNGRPDIAVSVGLLGRKVSEPNKMDWTAARRVVQYLKTTKDFKLRFGPGNGWVLTGYVDSDWAGDKYSRRSTTGYVFFYGGGPICWVSKRQDSVALSTLEAEYNALSLACQETVWLRRLLKDLDEPQLETTTIFEDNQGCLSFVKAERSSGRVKHIDTKSHYIRELCERKIVALQYCPSAEMIADALTKPLGPTMLTTFVDRLGLSK